MHNIHKCNSVTDSLKASKKLWETEDGSTAIEISRTVTVSCSQFFTLRSGIGNL